MNNKFYILISNQYDVFCSDKLDELIKEFNWDYIICEINNKDTIINIINNIKYEHCDNPNIFIVPYKTICNIVHDIDITSIITNNNIVIENKNINIIANLYKLIEKKIFDSHCDISNKYEIVYKFIVEELNSTCIIDYYTINNIIELIIDKKNCSFIDAAKELLRILRSDICDIRLNKLIGNENKKIKKANVNVNAPKLIRSYTVRWMLAYNNPNANDYLSALENSIRYELDRDKEDEVAAEGMPKDKKFPIASRFHRISIGLLVDKYSIIRRFKSDVWSEYNNDNKLYKTRKPMKSNFTNNETWCHPIYKGIVIQKNKKAQYGYKVRLLNALANILNEYSLPVYYNSKNGNLVLLKSWKEVVNYVLN